MNDDRVSPWLYIVRRVHKILDGDSMRLELDLGLRRYSVEDIRLFGFDAPEKNPRKSLEQTPEDRLNEQECAKEAAEFVQRWFDGAMSEGHVFVRTHWADSFGRWLADPYTASGTLGTALNREGLAAPWNPEVRWRDWDGRRRG